MIRSAPIALLALAACTQTPAPATADPASGAQCDATPVQTLIGQTADAAVDRAKTVSGARTVRRYESGSALTMDFRPDRLNVEVDDGGKIVKLSCG